MTHPGHLRLVWGFTKSLRLDRNSELHPQLLLLKGRKMVNYAKIVEKIARTFNCVDVNELSDHEGEIAIILTKAGLLDMDEIHTEDGEFLYSELYVTPTEDDTELQDWEDVCFPS